LNNIKNNYNIVLNNIADAANKSGRNPENIKVITVSKMRDVDVIRTAMAAGIRYFGENYPEQAVSKIEMINDSRVEWHMIGHIQSRKINLAAKCFHCVHSIDRIKIGRKLNNELAKLEKRMPILLELNVSGEESKFGWPALDKQDWENLHPDIDALLDLNNISLKGLMTMPPLSDESGLSRKYFIKLRKIQEYLSNIYGEEYFRELSMGTSFDYTVAVEEGATMVRIGEAILGPRKY